MTRQKSKLHITHAMQWAVPVFHIHHGRKKFTLYKFQNAADTDVDIWTINAE